MNYLGVCTVVKLLIIIISIVEVKKSASDVAMMAIRDQSTQIKYVASTAKRHTTQIILAISKSEKRNKLNSD